MQPLSGLCRLLLCALVGMATAELVHLSVLFRHGHRSPVDLLPSQDFTVENYWKDGLGQLTNIGKINQFNLGQFLRKRYGAFLGSRYNSSDHYVRSTDVDRTLMSAQACLAGLFPPAGDQRWNPELLWQPIPVHTRPQSEDRLLASPEFPCPKRDRLFAQVRKDPARLKFYEPYAAFLRRLSAGAGKPVTPESVHSVLDTLWINKIQGLPAPAWLNYSGPDWQRLVTVGSYQWREYSWSPDLVRFGSGVLMDSILSTVDNISRGILPDSCSRMSRLLSLIRSHKLLSALVAGTVAADAAYYGLHDLAQSYRAYRSACTQQGSSEMLSASQELRSALQAAADRLGIQAGCIDRLSLFVCRGVDPVRFGRLSASQGFQAYLGLPQHFDYRRSDSEQRHVFFFDDRALSLNTKKGRELYRDCLLLSEDELGFALARELAYLTSYAAHVPPVAGTLAAAGMIGTTYWFTSGSGQLFVKTLLRNRLNRQNLLVSVLVAASGGLWTVMAYQWHSAYCKSLDARVDRRAAAAYPRGGASFYQKQVRRNTLLRAMLGDSIGKKYFTVRGNEVQNWVLSDPFLPVNQRWSKLRYDQSLAGSESSVAST